MTQAIQEKNCDICRRVRKNPKKTLVVLVPWWFKKQIVHERGKRLGLRYATGEAKLE